MIERALEGLKLRHASMPRDGMSSAPANQSVDGWLHVDDEDNDGGGCTGVTVELGEMNAGQGESTELASETDSELKTGARTQHKPRHTAKGELLANALATRSIRRGRRHRPSRRGHIRWPAK